MRWIKNLFRHKARPNDQTNMEYLRYSDLPAQRIIDGAVAANLKDISIVGWTHDGKLYMASSHARRGSTYWDLGLMQRELMDK